MIVGIIGLLAALAPLLIKTGSLVIDTFVSDRATANQMKLNFLNTISAHVNDALASANEHTNYNDQQKELENPDPPAPT